MATPAPALDPFCQFCIHPRHEGFRCTQCKCKGKKGFWRGLFDAIGNAIGQAKFGGQ